MPSDRHIELQNMIQTWIGNRSVKMFGLPECGAVGYVADFVAVSRMNDPEHEKYCKNSGLTAMSMHQQWQGKGVPYKWVTTGDIDRHYVNVFEVKVSRADFLNTFGGKDTGHAKARMEPAGTAHWLVAEKGICRPEELPDFWGLIEPYGSGLSEKKKPKLNILAEHEIHAIAFDMMWLSMNTRVSYFDQICEMAKAVRFTHSAIVREKPRGEILRRSEQAVKTCCGLLAE
ncbi:hypothetical protein KAR91_57235 [Candidatus Pacearchaeota archaeon]|nr:hypothetical protein [Candidatus Pacearchaeota archaeon]